MKQVVVSELQTGMRINRERFHTLYEQTPEDFRAELIGGVVYVRGRVRVAHGHMCVVLGSVIHSYGVDTPGVEALLHVTLLLGDDSEPEPDILLRVLPEFGGQCQNTADDYVAGPPELIAEIAYCEGDIDLQAKHHDYSRYGVREYVVVTLEEKKIRWFDLPADRELEPDADGILRVRSFPGLWINCPALFQGDAEQLKTTLDSGLATPEHAAFIQQLSAARSRQTQS